MPTPHRLLLIFVGSLLLPSVAWADKPPAHIDLRPETFERVAKRRGVTVLRAAGSDVDHVAAIGRIPATPEKIRRALLAFDRHVGVMPRVEKIRILSRGKSWLVVYQRFELPLIADRDVALKVDWGMHKSIRWIRYKAVWGGVDETDAVRVTRYRALWELEPIGTGRETLLRYELTIDLGGRVPKWLTKSREVEYLPNMFAALCRLSVTADKREACP